MQPNSIGVPRARATDPETSHEAAASVTNVRPRQAAVLEAFRVNGPMTDSSLRRVYSGPAQSDSGLRTRRCELVTLGLLVDTGKRERASNGRRAIVWGLADGVSS